MATHQLLRAFGVLFLKEIRAYREGDSPDRESSAVPFVGDSRDSPGLAGRMLPGGLRAVLTCIDSNQLALM